MYVHMVFYMMTLMTMSFNICANCIGDGLASTYLCELCGIFQYQHTKNNQFLKVVILPEQKVFSPENSWWILTLKNS